MDDGKAAAQAPGNVAQLRVLYPEPGERARRKQLDRLDVHCRRFIELSPFVVVSSSGADGALDASPRGGDPGFVQVEDERTLLLPDAPGNNRLDTLQNVIATGRIGLLFLVPGVDESLRVNGRAQLSVDPRDLARCALPRRQPKVVIRIAVEDAYLHCAKALMRSELWNPAKHVPRESLPTMGRMIGDQTGLQIAPETQEEMVRRYAEDL